MLAALLGGGPAAPTQQPHGDTKMAVGQWGCQQTYTEFDQMGNRTSGHTTDFVLAVQADGQYQVGGTIWGGVGSTPFQGNGQWQVQNGQFLANGTVVQSDMFGTLSLPFVVIATLSSDGSSMSFRQEMPNSTQTGILNRTLVDCQRQG
jgi:hypothetical protein